MAAPMNPSTYRRRPSCFVLARMGVPQLENAGWSLAVGGLVRRQLVLNIAALQAMPQTRLAAMNMLTGGRP